MGKCMRRIFYASVLSFMAVLLCFLCFACSGSALKSIEVSVDPVEYFAGDEFDSSTITVDAVYSDGSMRTVTGWTTDAPNILEAGELTITVTYTEGGKSASTSFDIAVSEKEHEHVFGTEWKFDGQVHYRECACGARADEQAHVKVGIFVTSESDCVVEGERVFSCSVCDVVGKESIDALGHNFTIPRFNDSDHWIGCSRCNESIDKNAHSLTLYVENFRTIYSEGDTITLDGATALVECADCAFVKDVDVSEITLSKTQIGADDDGAQVTLSYGSVDTTVNISVVVKELIGIRAEAAKNKTAYKLNENFAAGKLTLVYNNQTTEDIVLTSDMVTGFTSDAYGVKTLTIEYDGFDCTLDVVVVKELDPSSGFVKFQAEDDTYVDMSKAEKQDVNVGKFETMTTLTNGGKLPSGAEGSSTSNISVKGNKIILRFYALASGTFTLGIRAQSASGRGRVDQPIEDVLALTVNGDAVEISGVIEKASKGSTDWRDMLEWTVLEDIASELELEAGMNVIEFAFLGETAAEMRFPNIDYFTVNIKYCDELTVSATGEVDIPYGGDYTSGLTLTVRDGDKVLADGVQVTAEMISGLDNLKEGEQEITITYYGLTVKHTVEVVVERLTLTVDGGTFVGGGTSVMLRYGETVPAINWTARNIIGYAFNGTVLDSINGLTMCATDTTLKAITASDATNIKLSTTIRFNSGPTADDSGKTTGPAGNTSATTSNISVLGTNDGTRYQLSTINVEARGITFRSDINFGPGRVYVFVKVINNSSTDLSGFAYGTETGTVSVGNISAGDSAFAGAVINSDGADHWTNIFWDGQISALDFTIAIYTYAVNQ